MNESLMVMHRVLDNRRREQGREDVDMSDVLDGLQKKARDHARTPVQVRICHARFKRPVLTFDYD